MVSWCGSSGGAGVLPRKRCDWTGRRRKLADCGRPHASRGVALLDRGGPLAGEGEVVGGQGRSLWIDLRVPRGTAWGVGLRGGGCASGGGGFGWVRGGKGAVG